MLRTVQHGFGSSDDPMLVAIKLADDVRRQIEQLVKCMRNKIVREGNHVCVQGEQWVTSLSTLTWSKCFNNCTRGHGGFRLLVTRIAWWP